MGRLVFLLLICAALSHFFQAYGKEPPTEEFRRLVEDTRIREEAVVKILACLIRDKYRMRSRILEDCRCSVFACGSEFDASANCTELELAEAADLGCKTCGTELVRHQQSLWC